MKRYIISLILGGGIVFLMLWVLGFRQQPDDIELEAKVKVPSKDDISWLIQLEGYPQLIYKDTDLLNALLKPDNAIVYRVKNSGSIKIGQYGLNSAVNVSESDAEYFSKVVCSPTSMTGPSLCIFDPGFAIRFNYGSRSFYALVCYSCSDILFLNEKAEELMFWGMTDESAFVLLDRFCMLFPNDSEVQALKP